MQTFTSSGTASVIQTNQATAEFESAISRMYAAVSELSMAVYRNQTFIDKLKNSPESGEGKAEVKIEPSDVIGKFQKMIGDLENHTAVLNRTNQKLSSLVG